MKLQVLVFTTVGNVLFKVVDTVFCSIYSHVKIQVHSYRLHVLYTDQGGDFWL